MNKIIIKLLALIMASQAFAYNYPDRGGLVNFDRPRDVHERIFIMTNPKSGSHLLWLGLTKLTQRVIRNRHPSRFWIEDANFQCTKNMMNYPFDFSKDTIYAGHEYEILSKLNHSNNKLIFTLRNYVDNICSILTGDHQLSNGKMDQLDRIFKKEVLEKKYVFIEYMNRLKLFHRWESNKKLLVNYVDLVKYPKQYIPDLLQFIKEDIDPTNFIEEYEGFKKELLAKYNRTRNNSAFSKSINHYRDYLSDKTLDSVDQFIKKEYPKLWSEYLYSHR